MSPRAFWWRAAPRNLADGTIGTAPRREAAGAFPRNQGLETGPHDGCLFLETTELSCLAEQVVIDVQRGPHMHHCARTMHIRQTADHLSMISSDAPVEIVAYDPAWPGIFEGEAEVLRHALAPWLTGPIEHIGSTAVPGLAAKPIVDIMAGVETLDASRPAIVAATDVGYCHAPYRADVEHWFCKPSPTFRTHHLHLVPMGSPQWVHPIAFRDYLRAHRQCRQRVRSPETAAGSCPPL